MASLIYTSGIYDGLTGAIDYDTDTFNVSLHTSAYTPDKDHANISSVTSEVTGTGYTAGGKAATVSVTKDTVNDRVDLSLGGTSWTSSTITARYAVYRKATGGALVAVVDFGSDVVSSSGTFTLNSSTLRIQN